MKSQELSPTEDITKWFKLVEPDINEITDKRKSTQIGCILEEFQEFLLEYKIINHKDHDINEVYNLLSNVIFKFKTNQYKLDINRIKVLDAICDIIVTLVGYSYENNIDLENGLKEVSKSNFSKFENNKPLFDENHKIKKGKNYIEPNLKQFI